MRKNWSNSKSKRLALKVLEDKWSSRLLRFLINWGTQTRSFRFWNPDTGSHYDERQIKSKCGSMFVVAGKWCGGGTSGYFWQKQDADHWKSKFVLRLLVLRAITFLSNSIISLRDNRLCKKMNKVRCSGFDTVVQKLLSMGTETRGCFHSCCLYCKQVYGNGADFTASQFN